MGINNLLVYLRSIEQKKHITDYHGQTIAVDGYCWIHKAIYTSGYEIAVQNDYSKLIK
jgi:exonuclease-1